MLGVVVGLQLANKQWTVLELAVLCPMLAATFAGPRLTAMYGVLAVLAGVLLGLHDDLFGKAGGGAAAQSVRLSGVAVGAVLAVLVSRYNTRRETKLQNISRVAEVAQQTILTPVPRTVGGLRFAARYESAAAEAVIGGDLYEVIDTPWGTRLLVGDVRGKGLEAVRIASRVLGCFRLVARQAADPQAILTALDAEAAQVCGPDDFVTAVVGQVRGRCLRLVNAGHPDPLLVRGGRARPLEVAARLAPLGLMSPEDNTLDVTLRAGDRLLLYTDGITEARDPATRGFLPLVPAVEASFARADLDEALDGLLTRVRAWTHSAQSDDAALLAVEVPRGGLRRARTVGGPGRRAAATARSRP
ncbi:serine/threonine-protein phosphatase [Frankia sp. AgKG'84/4]|nr:serine/threonine-protein phosphatase [Frankia sp. AgKG'84/4]